MLVEEEVDGLSGFEKLDFVAPVCLLMGNLTMVAALSAQTLEAENGWSGESFPLSLLF